MPLNLLFDSGSATAWTNKQSLPKGIQGHTVDKVTGSTLAGTFMSVEQVCLEDFSLPDFHPELTLPKLKAHVFHADCCHNLIAGHNALQAFGVHMDFEEGHLVCDGVSVPVCKFPNNASKTIPVEHLLQDCLNRNEWNDKDGFSFTRFPS